MSLLANSVTPRSFFHHPQVQSEGMCKKCLKKKVVVVGGLSQAYISKAYYQKDYERWLFSSCTLKTSSNPFICLFSLPSMCA